MTLHRVFRDLLLACLALWPMLLFFIYALLRAASRETPNPSESVN